MSLSHSSFSVVSEEAPGLHTDQRQSSEFLSYLQGPGAQMALILCGPLASHINCLGIRIGPFENRNRRQHKNYGEREFEADNRRKAQLCG